MGIGRKNIFIRYYIQEQVEKLKKLKIEVSEEEFEKLIEKFSEKRLGTLELIHEVNDEFKRILQDYYEQKDLVETFMKKLEANKDLKDLPLEYSGITLNEQDIDLMRIEDSKTPEELEYTLQNASNRQPLIENFRLTDKQFLEAKKKSYELYQDTLEDTNEEIKDPTVKTRKKIEYLKDSGELTEEEKEKIDFILISSSSSDEITEKVGKQFDEEKTHKIYEIINECTPIEKEGIKKTTPEASANLLKQVKKNYNSITIDDAAKYYSVVLPDESFDFRFLNKTLEFAKKEGKKVRLNTLIFYNDCPEELYKLEKNETNRTIVKEKLKKYIDGLTNFVKNNYESTVRSIDVFNELPNRFPMEREPKYQYRGDINQNTDDNNQVSDNIKSGWEKHLSVEDLCEVASVARKNLPETDFMYNDDNLIDSDKLEVTREIISNIQKYEQEHNIKLIDSIGTQMHVDNSITEEQIVSMFRELSKFGLPIEVTEFDLAMTHNTENLTDEEIEILRQQKMNEIISCIEELREDCNIRGVTIWSKTDSQNFRVKLANEELIPNGKKPIETLHGGYFTEKMEPKSKIIIKEKNNQENLEQSNSIVKKAEKITVDEDVDSLMTKLEMNEKNSHLPSSDSNNTLKMKKEKLQQVRESIIKGKSICSNKEELINFVKVDLQTKKEKQTKSSKKASSMFSNKTDESIVKEQPKEEKAKVLRPQNHNAFDNSNKGYVETLSLYTTIIAAAVIMIIMLMIIMF